MKRPREITAAALVALIGGGLFMLAGLILAGSMGVMLLSISQKYPGANLHSNDPDFLEVVGPIGAGMVLPLLLGVIGIFTGRGLLRLRPWARKSAVAWSIGSSLLCLTALAYAAPKPGMQPSAAPILVLMLVLFPMNAGWVLLFCRAETKALFAPPAASGIVPRVIARPEWLPEGFVVKVIISVGVIFLLALGAGWRLYQKSPMREIERARDALAAVKSWHYHTVRFVSGRAPETIEMDTLCPLFQHRTASSDDADGVTQVRETIRYFSRFYNHMGDRWLAAPMRNGQVLPEIFECRADTGALGEDEYSLPWAGVIEAGSVKRGEAKDVNDESCREYEIAVPTPHDPEEKEFQSTVCINQQDHFPRETRRALPDSTQEGVSTDRQWNARNEPQLPAETAK